VVALHASPLGLLLSGAGVVTLVTGVFGYCPACAIAGRKSVGRSAGTAATAASMARGLAALVALRGCPICWTTGLVEMVWSRTRRAVR
jgi:hypothetical protein